MQAVLLQQPATGPSGAGDAGFQRGAHWQVHKFGGTCMAAAERIRAAAELVIKEPGSAKVVVVSAMGSHPTSPLKVTDVILNMIKRAEKQDAAFLLDLAALQDKHVETAKRLLGQGPELTTFVARLLDDIANLKAMLQAVSIGACAACWPRGRGGGLVPRRRHRVAAHAGTAARIRAVEAHTQQCSTWLLGPAASRAHRLAVTAAVAVSCALPCRPHPSATRSGHDQRHLLRLRGGPRRAVERAALCAVLQAAGRRRQVRARLGTHCTPICRPAATAATSQTPAQQASLGCGEARDAAAASEHATVPPHPRACAARGCARAELPSARRGRAVLVCACVCACARCSQVHGHARGAGGAADGGRHGRGPGGGREQPAAGRVVCRQRQPPYRRGHGLHRQERQGAARLVSAACSLRRDKAGLGGTHWWSSQAGGGCWRWPGVALCRAGLHRSGGGSTVVSRGAMEGGRPVRCCAWVALGACVCACLQGQATTLKRNGSDFSATILGALFRSGHITIWTDVDGVYSADPRKVRWSRVCGRAPSRALDTPGGVEGLGAGGGMRGAVPHFVNQLARGRRDSRCREAGGWRPLLAAGWPWGVVTHVLSVLH